MSLRRSRKSREKHADMLVTMSSSLAVALTTTMFLGPMGFVLHQFIKREPIVALWNLLTPGIALAIFLLCAATSVMVLWSRRAAFEIYDSLYPDEGV